MSKLKIKVDSRARPDGGISPQVIYWEDGRHWEISRVLHVCPYQDGEIEGTRYTIKIGEQIKSLFQSGVEWFVEIKGSDAV